MPFSIKITPKIILLFQGGFAGVLLAQIMKLASYQQPNLNFYLLAGGLLFPGVFLLVKKRKLQLFFFRWIPFNWLSFSFAIIYGAILLLLFALVFYHIEENEWMLYVLQFGSILALFLVVAESYLLRLPVLSEVYAQLLVIPKGKVFSNYCFWFTGLILFAFLYYFTFDLSNQDLKGIIWHSLYLNGLLFFLLTGGQLVLHKKLAQAGTAAGWSQSPGEKEPALHSFYVQKHYFYLEQQLEEIVTGSDKENLPLIYSKLRQIPFIDKIEILEHLQQTHLPNDEELAYTLYFLQKVRAKLTFDTLFDTDELSSLIEIKGYIRAVIKSGNPMLVQKLLNDNRPEIKKAAMFAAVNFREPSLIPSLVNLLKDQEYAFSALEVLYAIGERCLPYVRSAKYRNRESVFFMERCLELVGSFKSTEAKDFLLEVLNEPQKSFQSQAALALIRNEFSLTVLHKTQTVNLIESTVAVIAVLREVICVTDKISSRLLHEALKEEEREKRELVVNLLGAFLNKPVFCRLKSCLTLETVQDLPTLFSLIDLYLPLVLRNKLKILFGSPPSENIAKKLQTEYVNEQLFYNYTTQQEAVSQILKLDYGQIGYWLRVNALKHLALVPEQQPSIEIISEVFNQNLLLQEVAAEVLYDLNFDYYFLYMQRLPIARAKIIKHKIETYKVTAGKEMGSDGPLLFYQILFLRSLPIFKECTSESLARNIHLFSLLSFNENKRRLKFDPYKPNGYWLVCEGEFTIYHRGEPLLEGRRGKVIDMSFLMETGEEEVSLHPKGKIKIYFIEYCTLNKLYLKPLSFNKHIVKPKLNYSAKLQIA